MKSILVITTVLVLTLAAGIQAEARTPRVHTPRAPKVHAPKSTYRSVRIRRADGTVLTGHRDSLGTHLTGPDGRAVNCQRQVGATDINVTCH